MSPNVKTTLENFFHRFDARWKFFHRIRNREKILELGCGVGLNYQALETLNFVGEYHGVDILPPSQVPSKVIYHQLDLDSAPLPYADATFDAILFTHVIEHLRNPLHAAGEIHRLLKPGGIIYIETPNWTSTLVPSFGFRREQHNPFNFFDDYTHIRPWTKQALFEFLSLGCRLRVECVATVRNWPRMPFEWIRLLYELLRSNRQKVVSSFWNIFGWCIYGIGIKEASRR